MEVLHDATALVTGLLEAGAAIRGRFERFRQDAEARFQNAPAGIQGKVTFGPLLRDAFDVEMLGVTVAFRLHLLAEQAILKGVVRCVRAPRHLGEEPVQVGEFTFDRHGVTSLSRGGTMPSVVSFHDAPAVVELTYSALVAALRAP